MHPFSHLVKTPSTIPCLNKRSNEHRSGKENTPGEQYCAAGNPKDIAGFLNNPNPEFLR
jgi:hypothetical protein